MIQVRLASHGVDVEFQAAPGITTLFGPAGAGKTLILDSIAGFTTPHGGRIILDDVILFDGASGVNLAARRRHCGYVARDWALFPHMSVHDNLLFPLARLRAWSGTGASKKPWSGSRSATPRPPPQEVSPAERLRAAVARALIGEPKALLVDDPAAGLDMALRAEWHATLRRVRDETALPVLVATRDPETCFELAGNMLLLEPDAFCKAAPRARFSISRPVWKPRGCWASATCFPPKSWRSILAAIPAGSAWRISN